MENSLLKMEAISKSFNGVTVLNEVDFELRSGEVHALMGGNGAGKSTLMKILTGVYTKDEGSIYIDGKEIEIKTSSDARQHGITMIFQEFSVIPTLTVAQNIFLTREEKNAGGLINDKKLNEKAREILQELNVDIDPSKKVSELSVGYWQMTEIAKAISQDTRILIMDEPTSALTKRETEELFKLIDRLKERGITIIYISHRMDEIFEVSDRVTILRNGTHAHTSFVSELTMESLVHHIIGEKTEGKFEWKERKVPNQHTPVLQVKNLSSGSKLNGISFDLYPGEILGVAGLMGSGRTEMARALFGIDTADNGEIIINGNPIKIKKPEDAIKSGIALVPEDRRIEGLVLEHNLRDNLTLPILSSVSKWGLVDRKKGADISQKFVKKLNIKTDSINKTIKLLSGGNQQKVVLAKWLANNPDILILDEPTSGVDIGAKTEILDIIRELADEGKSIIVISSEIPELLAISDQIMILKDGKNLKRMDRRGIESEEEIEHAIQGI